MTMLSRRIDRLEPSPIRDILHVIDQPGMISFAGGLPSADSFPEIGTGRVSKSTLQYGPSEGDAELRSAIAQELCERGLPTQADRVLVLSGSQQGIDLVGKLLVDEGTSVAVESPTYLAALQVFSLFGARYLPFSINALDAVDECATFLYAIPTFQNPTGHCYDSAQRNRLAEYCESNNTLLFEDDPYRELAYEPCDRTPVCAKITRGSWIYQSSFSKTLAPALRLGYMTCSEDLYPHLVQLKQAADLHTNRIGQAIALGFMDPAKRHARTQEIIKHYRQKRDYFNDALNRYFGNIAGWQIPAGGLFFWLTLNEQYTTDTRSLLPEAIKQKIAFMPGETFFPGTNDGIGTLRLNFSLATPDQVETGLARLAALIKG